MSLPRSAFYVVSALHHCLLFVLFLADQIFHRSYVYRQHFRLRSFASLSFCNIVPLLILQVSSTELGSTFESTAELTPNWY